MILKNLGLFKELVLLMVLVSPLSLSGIAQLLDNFSLMYVTQVFLNLVINPSTDWQSLDCQKKANFDFVMSCILDCARSDFLTGDVWVVIKKTVFRGHSA